MKKSEEMRLFFENKGRKETQESVSALKTEKIIPESHEAATISIETPRESLVQKIKKKIVKIKS